MENIEQDEAKKTRPINKGGRPRIGHKRTKILKVVCNAQEKNVILENAKNVNMTTSEFLRELGLKCKIVSHKKLLPPEVLLLTGKLNGISSSLNQLAKMNNQYIQFTPEERTLLFSLTEELHQLANQIKEYLR